MAQISKEDIAEIRKFNRNVDWMRTQALYKSPVSAPSVTKQWLSVSDAMKFVNRSRSWLQRITVTVPTLTSNIPELIKGVDWKRETNRIYYKLSSMENLKKSMEKAGDSFDERLAEKRV